MGKKKSYKYLALRDISTEELVSLLRKKKARIGGIGCVDDKIVKVEVEE